MLKQPFRWYLAALLVMVGGALLAAQDYPGGFDWQYTVASALMSQKHNPRGSFWFAISLSLSLLLLWPYVSSLQHGLSRSRLAIAALRLGLVCGILLGMERFLIHDLSHWLYKGHEALALLSFIGLYIGILGFLSLGLLQHPRYRVYVLLGTTLLIAIRDRKSTRLNSSHTDISRMPSSACKNK